MSLGVSPFLCFGALAPLERCDLDTLRFRVFPSGGWQTLGLPVVAALPPGEEALFRLALDLAASYRPLTAAETAELQKLADSLSPIFHHA